MDETLPSQFDVIVVGTGLTESIVAAAASRVGKSVLHVDANDFYGGTWASFSLQTFAELTAVEDPTVDAENRSQNAAEPSSAFRLANALHSWTKDVDTKEALLKASRRFNIDVSPRLLYSRGQMVELLISSNICRYSEFRAVDRVCTHLDGVLKPVPCSRSDIFTSNEVSVVEKRQLSKHLLALLNLSAADADVHEKYAGRTFREYLVEQRLSERLVHYVLHAIAMCNEQSAFAVGAERTKRFLLSAERYGTTPFLFAMYGCGELPQCFCRLCAVFGGVYCLKRRIGEVHRDADGKFEAVTCGEQRIAAKDIVFGAGVLGKEAANKAALSDESVRCGNVSRGVLISRRPLGDETLNSGGGGVILLRLPGKSAPASEGPGAGNNAADAESGAQVLQLSHFSGTCPKDWYLIHLSCRASDQNDPASDLAPYIAVLLGAETSAEDIVFSAFFSIPECGQCGRRGESTDRGVHHVCGPYFELDYERSIDEARALFGRLYADEEFLPRAPDPEEILVAGSEEDADAVADGAAKVEEPVTSDVKEEADKTVDE